MRKNRTFLQQVFVALVPNSRWNGAVIVEPFHWDRKKTGVSIPGGGAIRRALNWQQFLDENPWAMKLDIAENEGISSSIVYLHLALLKLPQEIIDFVLGLEKENDRSYFSERRLRPLLKLPREKQLGEFEAICSKWRELRARQRAKKNCKT